MTILLASWREEIRREVREAGHRGPVASALDLGAY